MPSPSSPNSDEPLRLSGWSLIGRLLSVGLALALGGVLVALLLAMAALLAQREDALHLLRQPPTEVHLFLTVGIYLMVLPPLLWFILNREGGSWEAWFLSPHRWGRELLMGWALGMGMVLALLLGLHWKDYARWEASGLLLGRFTHVLGAQALYLLAFLLQGGGEEFLFRSYFLRLFLRSMGKGMAVVLNAALFALLHLANPHFHALALGNTFLAGLLFALLTLRTGRLWMAVGAHASWNWMQAAVMGIPLSGLSPLAHPLWRTELVGPPLWAGGSYGLEGGLGDTVVHLWVLAMVAVLWESRREEG